MVEYECPNCDAEVEASPFRLTCAECNAALARQQSSGA